jgi:dihydrofolate reductase
MIAMLNSTNTNGGIAMSNKHQWEADAEERGYREAVLDMYCFLTGNEQTYDLSVGHLQLIHNMVAQVNEAGGKLQEVA